MEDNDLEYWKRSATQWMHEAQEKQETIDSIRAFIVFEHIVLGFSLIAVIVLLLTT